MRSINAGFQNWKFIKFLDFHLSSTGLTFLDFQNVSFLPQREDQHIIVWSKSPRSLVHKGAVGENGRTVSIKNETTPFFTFGSLVKFFWSLHPKTCFSFDLQCFVACFEPWCAHRFIDHLQCGASALGDGWTKCGRSICKLFLAGWETTRSPLKWYKTATVETLLDFLTAPEQMLNTLRPLSTLHDKHTACFFVSKPIFGLWSRGVG